MGCGNDIMDSIVTWAVDCLLNWWCAGDSGMGTSK